MRRFMPEADQSTLVLAAIWLMAQGTVFIRHREQLANPPISLDLNEAAVERLTKLVSSWVLTGMLNARVTDNDLRRDIPAQAACHEGQ